MENNLSKSCCFTGYRPEKFDFNLCDDTKEYLEFENKLYGAVFSLGDQGVTRFYCGMAMGFDILGAEAVLTLREAKTDAAIELICVKPFEEQAKSFPDFWKKKYNNILKEADEIVVMGKDYYKGCFHKRNCYMIDNSDMVLTYYDGKSGGTKSTLIYANKKGKKIVNIGEYGVQTYFAEDEEIYEIIEDEI
ncbi:MAG: DUF1273 family protein [Clostridia bacterium]|nr:DUF1273 family protein [Clostridia bacterium]